MGSVATKFYIELPVANPLRFTRDGITDNQRANFDQVRFAEAAHATISPREYLQPWEKADTPRIQYYTNFPLRKLEIVDADGAVVLTPGPNLGKEFRDKKYRSDCKFYSLNGKLFIFFDEGVEYTDANFTVQGDFVANLGRLPAINAMAGDVVRYKIGDAGILSTTILSVEWIPELQAEGYRLNVDITLLDPLSGQCEITYDEKDTALYYHELDFSTLDEGIYFAKLSLGISSYTHVFLSEPLNILSEHPETLAIHYRHDGTFDDTELWSYLYLNDWKNLIRIPANHHQMAPAGEVSVYQDDFSDPTQTRAVSERQVTLRAFNLPTWILDKFNVIFAHDTIEINGYQWEKENFGQVSYIDRMDVAQFEINLKQKNDRRLFSNEYEITVNASFNPASLPSVPFGGQAVPVTFLSNTLALFQFLNLPAWITADVSQFDNNDVVTLTIAPNAGFIERSVVLQAYSPDIDGLFAEITITQEFNETAPQFIDAESTDVAFGNLGGSQVIDISSSGDYDITFEDAVGFTPGVEITAVKQSGFSQVKIDAAANGSASIRTGSIKLALQSNPAVFETIFLEQMGNPGAVTISIASPANPYNVLFPTQNINVSILAPVSLQHNVKSNNDWITVTPSIKSGNQTRTITVKKNNGNNSRTGSVTFYSTTNALNAVTLTIIQAGQEV